MPRAARVWAALEGGEDAVGARGTLARAMAAGNAGQARIPGKHGAAPTAYTTVRVLIPDEPGQLGRLFADIGEIGTNIEEFHLDHGLGQPFGLAEVDVVPAAATDLAEALEDGLYALRLTRGEDAFPKPAIDYLNDWAAADKGWLRKYYKPGTDEAQFDLTPATEKALAWLAQLSERQFVGTESRLLTLFALLKQMGEGSETDPARRIAELQRKRDEIDAEMARVLAGDIPLLDDTAIKDRFQQFMQGARELLADFREVEHNFRQLDRRVRERIAKLKRRLAEVSRTRALHRADEHQSGQPPRLSGTPGLRREFVVRRQWRRFQRRRHALRRLCRRHGQHVSA